MHIVVNLLTWCPEDLCEGAFSTSCAWGERWGEMSLWYPMVWEMEMHGEKVPCYSSKLADAAREHLEVFIVSTVTWPCSGWWWKDAAWRSCSACHESWNSFHTNRTPNSTGPSTPYITEYAVVSSYSFCSSDSTKSVGYESCIRCISNLYLIGG